MTQDAASRAAAIIKRLANAQRCPNCPDQGWYAVGHGENVEQEQCQWCDVTPDSIFNVENQLANLVDAAENVLAIHAGHGENVPASIKALRKALKAVEGV